MLNRDSEIVIWWRFVNYELWSCDMNSTLGSVEPLAMFISIYGAYLYFPNLHRNYTGCSWNSFVAAPIKAGAEWSLSHALIFALLPPLVTIVQPTIACFFLWLVCTLCKLLLIAFSFCSTFHNSIVLQIIAKKLLIYSSPPLSLLQTQWVILVAIRKCSHTHNSHAPMNVAFSGTPSYSILLCP